MALRPVRLAVLEGTSGTVVLFLEDENGDAIPLTSVNSLTLDLFDVNTQETINNREDQDALNANGVAVAGLSGQVTWQYDAEDTPYLGEDDDELPQEEEHVAHFRATCTLNDRTVTIAREVRFRVKNVQRYSPTA
jgi:hypothetical protein